MNDELLASLWAAVPCLDETLRTRAEGEVRGCLEVPAIHSLLSRPSPEAELWREKRFEILLGHEWLSGTFDRVVIEPRQATIIDFKTDKASSAEDFAARIEGYRPQLVTYREVIHRMTGLPLDAIRCALIFTHRREVVEV